MTYTKMHPAERKGKALTPSFHIAITPIKTTHRKDGVLVRLTRGVLEEVNWFVGDRVNVEFDNHSKRLKLSRRKGDIGGFIIAGKNSTRAGGQKEGRIRWSVLFGRPYAKKPLITDRWHHRKKEDAIVVTARNMTTFYERPHRHGFENKEAKEAS